MRERHKINGTTLSELSELTIKRKELLYLQVGRKVHNCKRTPSPKTNELFLHIMKAERNKVTSIEWHKHTGKNKEYYGDIYPAIDDQK